MELFLNDKLGKISYEIDDSLMANAVLILAHGAGAGMHHPFLVALAEQIKAKGISVVRFNFPYMQKGRKAPGSPKDAIFTWNQVILKTQQLFFDKKLYISGKSYGGRMASHLIIEHPDLPINGMIYYGFPLHAPGKDGKDRAAHLKNITQPQLFLQGTRDKLANIEMMREVLLELDNSKMVEIEHGDHSFNVPKSKATKEEILMKLAEESANWIHSFG